MTTRQAIAHLRRIRKQYMARIAAATRSRKLNPDEQWADILSLELEAFAVDVAINTLKGA